MTEKTSGISAWDAVDILWETGALLVLSGAAKSRRTGFNKASQFLQENIDRWPHITAEELDELGWPEEARDALLDLLRGEQPSLFTELRAELGDEAASLLRVRGIGVDKAKTIHSELGITTMEELMDAAKSGVLLQVKGFGPKSVETLQENLEEALREKAERIKRRAEAAPPSLEEALPKALFIKGLNGDGPKELMDLLRCPATHQSGFVRQDEEAVLPPTGGRYPITNGVIDMIGEGHEAASLAQVMMESRLYSELYEGVFRPAFTRAVIQRSMPDDIALSLEMLQLRPDWAVLDVACGPGNFTRAIAHALHPYHGLAVGVDVSWTMLSKAAQHKERKGFTNLQFVRGSAMHLPFQNDSFDAIHCTAALHLFRDPARALQEFHRVTRKGGHLVLGTFLQSRFLPLRLLQRLGSPLTGIHWFSLEELEDIVIDAGFSISRTEINGLSITLAAKRV